MSEIIPNENIIRITKTASILGELELGRDYEIKIKASCVEKAKRDNCDNTFDYKYILQIIEGEILCDKGNSLKLNIKSPNSQKIRRACYAIGIDYDTFSEKVLNNIEEIDNFLKDK